MSNKLSVICDKSLACGSEFNTCNEYHFAFDLSVNHEVALSYLWTSVTVNYRQVELNNNASVKAKHMTLASWCENVFADHERTTSQ